MECEAEMLPEIRTMAIGNDKMLVLQERNSHFFVFQKNL
jgi:hypothetical protein